MSFLVLAASVLGGLTLLVGGTSGFVGGFAFCSAAFFKLIAEGRLGVGLLTAVFALALSCRAVSLASRDAIFFAITDFFAAADFFLAAASALRLVPGGVLSMVNIGRALFTIAALRALSAAIAASLSPPTRPLFRFFLAAASALRLVPGGVLSILKKSLNPMTFTPRINCQILD